MYIDGVWDLFHYGHANAIKQAKEMFENCELVVGINNDQDALINQGNLVLSQEERRQTIASCRYVDKIISPAPWYPSLDFIKQHQIDFVAHDEAPY